MPDCTRCDFDGVYDARRGHCEEHNPVHGTGRAKECRCVQIPPPSYHSEFAETVDMRACPIHGAKKYPTPPSQETKDELDQKIDSILDEFAKGEPESVPFDHIAAREKIKTLLSRNASTVADRARLDELEEFRRHFDPEANLVENRGGKYLAERINTLKGKS